MKQAQPSGNVGNRFKPGQSGNPRGRPTRAKIRARIEEHARLLAEEYGGWSGLTEIERTMLIQTATLLWSRPTTAYDRVRAANAIARCLDSLRDKPKSEPALDLNAPLPTAIDGMRA
jgi:hypothetical protein